MELRNLDMSGVEDRQRVVDFAIKLQTQINMAGFDFAKSDETASEMMSKSLSAAGVENMDDLKDSYADLHRTPFANGEFSVVFDGYRLTAGTGAG